MNSSNLLILLLTVFVLLQIVTSFNMKLTSLPSRMKGIVKKDSNRSYTRKSQPTMVVY